MIAAHFSLDIFLEGEIKKRKMRSLLCQEASVAASKDTSKRERPGGYSAHKLSKLVLTHPSKPKCIPQCIPLLRRPAFYGQPFPDFGETPFSLLRFNDALILTTLVLSSSFGVANLLASVLHAHSSVAAGVSTSKAGG